MKRQFTKHLTKAAAVLSVGTIILGNSAFAEAIQGTWSWSNGSIKPNAGTASYEATFTPSDTDNYESVTADISVTTLKYTPTVSVKPTVSEISYGQSLSESTFSGGKIMGANGAEITGTWSWSDSTANPTAGTHEYEAVFTPTDASNYNPITASLSVIVNKRKPVVSVSPTASEITYRQSLSDSVLSGASVDVDGTWAWKDGTVKPNAGVREYEATFTPNDTTDYAAITVNVSVTINKYRPTITELPTVSDNIIYGVTLDDITLSGGVVE